MQGVQWEKKMDVQRELSSKDLCKMYSGRKKMDVQREMSNNDALDKVSEHAWWTLKVYVTFEKNS